MAMTRSIDKLYTHPNPRLERTRHLLAVGLLGLIVFGIVGQFILAVLLHSGLFAVTGVVLILLIPLVLMLLSATPPLMLNAQGITIQPIIWKQRFIRWEDVVAYREYPLLPPAAQERERRLLVGKQKYKPAQGKMLVVRGLPFQYRAAGYFAGAHSQPIIAVTNRSHRDYEALVKHLDKQLHALTPVQL